MGKKGTFGFMHLKEIAENRQTDKPSVYDGDCYKFSTIRILVVILFIILLAKLLKAYTIVKRRWWIYPRLFCCLHTNTLK